MKSQIRSISPNDSDGYQKLVSFTEKIFNKGFSELSSVPFNNVSFMIKQIPSLLNLKSYKSVYSLVSSFVKNEKLRRIFSMHPLLVGGNPFTTTSIYGLILFLEKKWGIHYSIGGTGNIINGLEKLMIEQNIEIIKGHEVKKINYVNNKVYGIEIDNGEQLKANNVICNADPPNVYDKMISTKKNSSA